VGPAGRHHDGSSVSESLLDRSWLTPPISLPKSPCGRRRAPVIGRSSPEMGKKQ